MDRNASSSPLPLLRACIESTRGPLTVAFSGGADSTALLVACAHSESARSMGLRALHVHHGLHQDADAWAEHCTAVAAALGIALIVERVQVDPRGQGIEAAARAARFAAFECHIDGGTLLLAQHQDDQAETVLLRLLRGAAIDGVAAMRARRSLGSGELRRPWLTLPRATILSWLRETAPMLRWLDDPANIDPKFDRSFVRHGLLPQIVARFPAARERLARFAHLAREQQDEIDRAAAQALASCRHLDRACLDLDGLAVLSPAIRRGALRQFALERYGSMPGFHELERIEREVIGAREDADPQLIVGNYVFRRYRRTLYLLPIIQTEPIVVETVWPAGAERVPYGPLTLRAMDRVGGQVAVPSTLRLCSRQGGERMQVRAGGPRRELRDLFQELSVPPWQRARTPLLYAGSTLVAAIGVIASDALANIWPGLRIAAERSQQCSMV